jgi:hypothetical protein
VGWQAFVASLVQSLAWPAGVVAVVVVLRKPIGAVLGQGVRRVKAGPVEVEFDQLQAEVREELARSPELAEAQIPALVSDLREELSRLAEIAPTTAVVAAFQRIERRLSEVVDSYSPRARPYTALGGRALARLARELDLISDETLAAIEGLSTLRDLTIHSGGEIGVDRARDYLALADAVMYALRPKPSG